MTQEEFNGINWHRGNVVRLKNGKEYLVKGTKGHGKYLLLYSLEFDSNFVADHCIVMERTSDYEEPEEVYLEMKRQKQAEAQTKREAERQERIREKAEKRERNLREQERIRQEAKAAKEARRFEAQQKSIEANPVEPVDLPTSPVAHKSQKQDPQKPENTEESVVRTPRKRIRQRIKVTSVVREKVEFFKK